MAHHIARSAYHFLTERLDRFPQGAPPSETLYRILAVLFSEREAALVAQLPIKPFTAGQAARIWKVDLAEARRVLEELAGRAILVDVEQQGEMVYTLPPAMAGFFEFSMMRLRGDVDPKVLSELLCQYLTVEEDFFPAVAAAETSPGKPAGQVPLPGGAAGARAGVNQGIIETGGRLVASQEGTTPTWFAPAELPPGLAGGGHDQAIQVWLRSR
jgi:hypothetical protein